MKVISIGNLTLGGTGKTPAVIAAALEAKKRGYRPCILTRGYKGRAKGPCLSTSDGEIFNNASSVGDEAAYMAFRLHDIPIAKDKNRFRAGMYALEKTGPSSIDVCILDDGFQHRALIRDMDVLLIDATNPFGNGKLFPEGIMREPMESIRRADSVLITKSDAVSSDALNAIEKRIQQYSPAVPVYHAHYEPVSLMDINGESHSPDRLKGRQVHVVSGIANPLYFENLLRSLGAEIVHSKVFRDHYRYSQRDVRNIVKDEGMLDIITTEKDMVKLKGLELPGTIYSLRIDFVVENNFYDIIFGGTNDE
jgi:tetraacyldisaccharide 4'-kinase